MNVTSNLAIHFFEYFCLKHIVHRLKQALKAGFRHLIFEDNYDTGTGDHYSLRQICDQSYIRGLWLVILGSTVQQICDQSYIRSASSFN